jgi:hypothetical protein
MAGSVCVGNPAVLKTTKIGAQAGLQTRDQELALLDQEEIKG